MMLYLRLFYEFFKAGLFAIGGGLATLPFLYEISDKTGWFTHGQLADMIAVSESTPGPIGVNMATYVGFETGGPAGAVAATLGLIAPSVIIILIIAGFLKAFQDNAYVKAVFHALRPASAALIAAAGLGVVKISLIGWEAFVQSGSLGELFRWKEILLAVGVFFGIRHFKKLHPAVFIGISAVIGVLFRFAGA